MMILDVKGFTCPIPLLRAKKELKKIAIGETLQVIATDPNTEKDFIRFCSRGKYEISQVIKKEDELIFNIKKL